MEEILLGRFILRGLIAEGGMGVIYEAHDLLNETDVAIKMPADDRLDSLRAFARFGREARTMLQFDHPNVLKAYEYVEKDETALVVMELCVSDTLRTVIDEADEPMSVEKFRQYARDMASGTAYMHEEHGIAHRDLKPDNVFITKSGCAKIFDFGLSMDLNDTRFTRSDIVVGSPRYIAPEIKTGNPMALSFSCDVYALGVTFFEMLASKTPGHEPYSELNRLRPDLPPGLADIVCTCLAENPRDRYRDAGELLHAFETVGKSMSTRSSVKVPAGVASLLKTSRCVTRSPKHLSIDAWMAVAVMLAMTIIGGTLIAFHRRYNQSYGDRTTVEAVETQPVVAERSTEVPVQEEAIPSPIEPEPIEPVDLRTVVAIYDSGDFDSAQRRLERLVNAPNAATGHIVSLTWLMVENGERQAAEELINRFSRIRPTDQTIRSAAKYLSLDGRY